MPSGMPSIMPSSSAQGMSTSVLGRRSKKASTAGCFQGGLGKRVMGGGRSPQHHQVHIVGVFQDCLAVRHGLHILVLRGRGGFPPGVGRGNHAE